MRLGSAECSFPTVVRRTNSDYSLHTTVAPRGLPTNETGQQSSTTQNQWERDNP